MTALDIAADNLLDVTLRLFARGNAEALENMRDILVEQFGCTPVAGVEAVRGAMLRRASRSRNPALRALAWDARKASP